MKTLRIKKRVVRQPRRLVKKTFRLSKLPLAADPVASAHAAGLRYVNDDQPGIQRRRFGKYFRYLRADGEVVRDPQELGRIRALAIPPAWTQVWICPLSNGHLQATGRDSKGRKQYRYHPQFRSLRDEAKYERLLLFGKSLPQIRTRVEEDLKQPGLPRSKVLATVIRLLETTLIRVGNEEYARTNGSFGLTTMRNKHVNVEGSAVRFRFRGKSGIHHSIRVDDRRLARTVRHCQELPGQELFQYLDDDGAPRRIDSEDVNGYLQEISGESFTAKDFRTWAGTVLAARTLHEFEKFTSMTQAKRNVVAAIEIVPKRLGNTKAVCRKCYIHPLVVNAYLDGSLQKTLRQRAARTLTQAQEALSPQESALLAFLQAHLRQEAS